MDDLWHYPRTAFAQEVYATLTHGPVRGMRLFGPRRSGKTEFLRHDLAPLADGRGHRVLYIDCWQGGDSPLALLLYELDRALRAGPLAQRLKTAATQLATKFTLSLGPGTIEVDCSGLRGKAPENYLLLVDQYCERLASGDKPAFLLFDEFQQLAHSPSADMIAALRASLNKRRDKLLAVFTGSSQRELRRMFSTRDAPFFRYAQSVDLPRLDEAFIDHQLAVCASVFTRNIERPAALDAFAHFDNNPQLFQQWLMAFGTRSELSAQQAIAEVEQQFAEELGFGIQWRELTPAQRATARMLAESVQSMFGAEGAAFIEALTGGPAPSPSTRQAAIKRLSRLGLADKRDAQWQLSEPLFENWVRGRPGQDFR